MGYFSEGERTIDIQTQQAATLHMISIGAILPQFTKIYKNLVIVCEGWSQVKRVYGANQNGDRLPLGSMCPPNVGLFQEIITNKGFAINRQLI